MEIVKVRGKAKPFNRALDVLLDVRCGVGDGAIPEDIEAAL